MPLARLIVGTVDRQLGQPAHLRSVPTPPWPTMAMSPPSLGSSKSVTAETIRA